MLWNSVNVKVRMSCNYILPEHDDSITWFSDRTFFSGIYDPSYFVSELLKHLREIIGYQEFILITLFSIVI